MRTLIQCGLGLLVIAAGTTTGLQAQQSDNEPQASETTPGVAATPASQVRIVRLSEVRGKVDMARAEGMDFQPSFANLPIVAGSRLQAGVGVAEVEFEDNSSLRITPETLIDFTLLGRNTAGFTTNAVHLERGTLYVSLLNTKGTEFKVNVGQQTISLLPGSHVRVDVYPAGSELHVFHGKVNMTGTESVSISSGRTVHFDAGDGTPPVAGRDEEAGLYDAWDQKLADLHNVKSNSFAGSPYAYGNNDLSYYGSFANVSGCGQVWRPYLASAAWNPYASGMYAYYPGAGYSWVSPYPWGWTPYHSGSWVSCGAAGWGWQPGNGWMGLNNVATTNAGSGVVTAGTLRRQPAPLKAPTRGQSGLVGVGMDKLVASRMSNATNLEFAKDSAGFGLPRELGLNLRKATETLERKGSAHVAFPEGVALAQPTAPTTQRGLAGRPVGSSNLQLASRPVVARSSGMGTGSAGVSGLQGSSRGGATSTVSGSVAHGGASGAGAAGASGGGGGHH